ncbi:MAG: DUF3429 domain-containing protein [Pseudomonadota bacterium]
MTNPDPTRPNPNEPMPTAALILGPAGLIPFFATAIAAWFAPEVVQRLRAADSGMLYAAIILSFLGGIRWGLAMSPDFAVDRNRQIAISVLPSIAGWVALLLPSAMAGFVLIGGFMVMLFSDIGLVRRGRLPRWFESLRIYLSAGAILSVAVISASYI